MAKDKKKSVIKEYIFEIIVVIVTIGLMTLLLFNESVSNGIIINCKWLRPEKSFIIFAVLCGVTIIFGLIWFLHSRKKKLKSTKRKSAFAKTLDCSDKIREMSQTQTFYSSDIQIVGRKNHMPADIERNNSRVVELYFYYEENLNI